MVLVYRNVGNVILVNKDVTDDYQEPQVLATSAAGCYALGDAFKEMAREIRSLKIQEKRDAECQESDLSE